MLVFATRIANVAVLVGPLRSGEEKAVNPAQGPGRSWERLVPAAAQSLVYVDNRLPLLQSGVDEFHLGLQRVPSGE